MKDVVVWIVDDEPAICWSLRKAVESKGFRTTVYSNAEDAIAAAKDLFLPCDVIITDIRLPKRDGFSVAEIVRLVRPETPVILMTAFGDLATALRATKTEVFEYLVKPFDLKDALLAIDKALLHRGRGTNQADFSLSILESLLLGKSPLIQQVYKEIGIAARNHYPILIVGDEGAPLESVASAIHRNSERASKPFLSVTPTTISLASLEREFVGSAQRDRSGESLKTGLLGLVGEGTLFIEEIADLPKSVQLQLLRVLEQGHYLPFDATDSAPFQGRVIASTTRELAELVQASEFDARLEQRLQVHRIELPPLDSRREDTVEIAKALLARAHPEGIELAPDGEEWLMNQSWPGDVRQLRNGVERAAATTQSTFLLAKDLEVAFQFIEARQLSYKSQEDTQNGSIGIAIRAWLNGYLEKGEVLGPASPNEFGMVYEDFLTVVEPPLLKEMFSRCQYNRAATAAKLGMHRSTLRQKMRKYELD